MLSCPNHFFIRKCYRFSRKNWGSLLLVGWCWLVWFPAFSQPAFKFTHGQKKQKLRLELHRNLMIVKVQLNGKGPYNFLLDTGINTSLLTNASLQDTLKFSRGPAVAIAGAGAGSDLHAYFTPDLKVELPGITSQNLIFAVLSEDVLQLGSYVGIPVAGILGADLFQSFVVEVDFGKLKLTLHEPQHFKAPKNHQALPLELEENKPYVKTRVQASGQEVPVKLLLDTGAGYALSLDCASDNRLKLPEKTLRSQLGIGLSGTVNGHLGRIEKLEIGKYQVNDLLASFPDATALQGKTTVVRNGSLGLELLKRFSVIIDYPHRQLYLKRRLPLDKPFEYDLCGLDLVAVPPKYRSYQVFGVHKNSAAAEAGILEGDELLSLDLVPVSQLNLTQISRLFHSFPGRKIQLLLKREGQLIYTVVTLKRRI